MTESNGSFARNCVAFLIAVLILFFGLSIIVPNVQAAPGNDGAYCHGANRASCRPDPQPSHGQDCQPHGNNPDGNDDHCAPTPAPTVTPEPTPTATPAPTPTSSIDVPIETTAPVPAATLPATDTE